MPLAPPAPAAGSTSASPWDHAHRRLTAGILGLVVLGAFENRAVLSILPTIADALDGLGWYGAANAAATATLTLATVVAGRWTDRVGAARVLRVGLTVFLGAQLLAAVAPTMVVLVASRAVSGVAEGLLDIALTVVVARSYPEHLRPKVFAAFAAAWLLPSLLGPALTGLIDHVAGWRWVFAAPLVLALPAWLAVRPGLRGLAPAGGSQARTSPAMLRAALTVAAALAAVTSVGPWLNVPGPLRTIGYAVSAVGLLALAAGAASVLPAGSLTLRRGAPALVGMRLLVSMAFPGVGTFLPLMLAITQGAGPALAGVSLSVTGSMWALGSWLQSTALLQSRMDSGQRVRLGFLLIALGAVGPFALALGWLALVPGLVGWAACGVGMGILSPTLTTAALALAERSEEGQVSSAQVLAGTLGYAVPTAVGGALVARFADQLTGSLFAGLIGMSVVVALAGVAFAGRVRP